LGLVELQTVLDLSGKRAPWKISILMLLDEDEGSSSSSSSSDLNNRHGDDLSPEKL
jgi:hypothetical protein